MPAPRSPKKSTPKQKPALKKKEKPVEAELEPEPVELVPRRIAGLSPRVFIGLCLAAVALVSVLVVLLAGGGAEGWAIEGEDVEARLHAYLSAGRFARAHESLALIEKREGSSVRVQRMTLALAGAHLEAKHHVKAYDLVNGLSLVDKSDEVVLAILQVKFAALRPRFFTPSGDLRAPYNLPFYDVETSYSLVQKSKDEGTWPGSPKELAERYVEDLADADALARESTEVRDRFGALIELGGLIRWAWDIEDEKVFLAAFGDPALKPRRLRYQYANILFRERRIEEALAIFRPLLDKESGTFEARQAFGHIVRLYELRRALGDDLPFWSFDLGNLVERCLAMPGYEKIRAEALTRVGEALAMRPMTDSEDWQVEIERDVFENEKEINTEGPPTENSEEGEDYFDIFKSTLLRHGEDRIFLQTSHNEFQLRNPGKRPFHSVKGGSLTLYSLYRGVVRLSLYRFADYETYCAFAPDRPVETLNAERCKTWTHHLGPVSGNRRGAFETTIPVTDVRPGYYAVLAEARYCPVFSGTKLIVSDVMLAVRAGRTSLVAFTADRLTGTPLAALELTAEFTGVYDLNRLAADLMEKNPDADFRAGLHDGFAPEKDKAKEARQEELRRAGPEFRAGWEAGQELRQEYPVTSGVLLGKTDEEGVLVFTVPQAMQAHAYSALVNSANPGFCFWCSIKSREDTHRRVPRTLFYPDRPLYRPGDEVHFKGIVRVFDGEHYFLPEANPIVVEVRDSRGAVYHAELTPDDTGCVNGSFPLGADAAHGTYTIHVNDGGGASLFKVRNFEKPDLEVMVDADRSILSAGEHIKTRVRITTTGGEPLPGASVIVTIRRYPTALEHRVSFRLPGEKAAPGSLGGSGRNVLHKSYVADAQGEVRLSLKTDPDYEALYRIKAVTTYKRVRISASTIVEARSVPVRLTVRTDRAAYRPGTEMHLRILTRDLRGKPVAWRLRIREIPAEPTKKSKRPFERIEPQEKEFATDGKGEAEITFPVRRGCAGYIVGIRFKGRWHDRDVPVEVMGAGKKGKGDIILHRDVYLPGDTLEMTVKVSPHTKAVLLTGETDRILFHRVGLAVEKRVRFSFPVDAAWGPNFFLAVTAVTGDQVKVRISKTVRVVPVHKFLRLEITTDKSEYRPGETCRGTVRVTDYDDQPRPGASVSVGVVDAAIYRLEKDRVPDLWGYFYSHSLRHLVTDAWFNDTFSFPGFVIWKTPVFGWGYHYFKTAIGIGGGAGGSFGGRFGGKRGLRAYGGGRALRHLLARSRFRDLAFWRADLRSDDKGLIHFTFPVPDNITRFRFTARGITADTRVGEVRDSILVRKNFYALLRPPELLRQGDLAQVRVVVRNRWNTSLPARLVFHSPFPLAGGDPAASDFSIPAGGERIFRFTVDLAKPPKNKSIPGVWTAETDRLGLRWDETAAVFRADLTSRDDSGEEDAVIRAVPYARCGAMVRSGLSGVLEGKTREKTIRLHLPKDAVLGRIEVRLSGSLPGAVLDGLDELMAYPYGCVEQTLSRFFPAAAVCRAAHLAGQGGETRERYGLAVNAGISGLGRLRLKDGSWGWFGRRDASVPFMTSWAVLGLSLSREAGFAVPPAYIKKAIPHLENVITKTGTPPRAASAFGEMNLRVLSAVALSWAGRSVELRSPHLVRYLLEGENDEDLTRLDMAALAYVMACENLVARGSALLARFDEETLSAERDPKTLAFWLLAAEKLGSDGQDRSSVAMSLLKLRRGRSWKTTTDSALAVFALAEHLASDDWKSPGARASVHLGESELARIGDGTRTAVGTLTAKELSGKTVLELLITRTSELPVFWSASVQSLSPLEMAKPLKRGLEVRTRIYRPQRGGAFVESDEEGEIPVGDRIRVKLTLSTAEPQDYLVLVQPLPSTMRPVLPFPASRAWPRSLPMHLMRARQQPGLLDLRRFGADLHAAEDAVLAGRNPEALGILLTTMQRAFMEKGWAVQRKGLRKSVHLARVHRVELRREAIVFFISGLPVGSASVLFDLVCSSPCRVTLPPAYAAPMYRPEVFARARAVRILAGTREGKAPAEGPVSTVAWPDEDWVGAMLEHASATLAPDRAKALALALRQGDPLRRILIREILLCGGPGAVEVAFRGFPYRHLTIIDKTLDKALTQERDRRREVLNEYLAAREGAAKTVGALLAKVLADESLYDALEASNAVGLAGVRPSTLLSVVEAEEALRMTTVSALPWGTAVGKPSASPRFRLAAGILLKGEKLPAHSRSARFLQWNLTGDVEDDWVERITTYGDLVSFLRDRLSVSVDMDPAVPKDLLAISTDYVPFGQEEYQKDAANFGEWLRGKLRRVELALETTSTGLVLTPLGRRVGFDEATLARRFRAILTKWKSTRGAGD